MPLRRPDERIRDALRIAFQGSLGGDELNAQPFPADVPVDGGGGITGTDDSSETGSSDIWVFEKATAVAAGAQSYICQYVPITESLFLFLNGLALEEGSDYTVNWDTGTAAITFAVAI